MYFMHHSLALKVIKWKEKCADTDKKLVIVQESANILARTKVCIHLYHTCSSGSGNLHCCLLCLVLSHTLL